MGHKSKKLVSMRPNGALKNNNKNAALELWPSGL